MTRAAPVAGVILAAGRSRRFAGGGPKQLAEIAGVPLVRRVASAALASRLGEVVVVLGHEAEAVVAALDGLEVRRVMNPEFDRGQSTSVRAGLAALGADAAAAIFLLADQPLLAAATIDRLIAAWEETGGPIVVPSHAGDRGSPALFDRSLWAELQALRGDAGGRQILARHRGSIVTVAVEDRRQLADVDTAEDLRRLERSAGLATPRRAGKPARGT